jgi:hypothetical protein
MNIRVHALTLGLILLFTVNAPATTVERLTLDGLVRKADSIIVGKVIGSRTFWSGNNSVILTAWSVEVLETIKGPVRRSIEVTTIGGTVGDITLHVAGMPVFETGRNAVVFVEKSGAFSTVVGLGQGKFTVENGEVVNTVGGLEFYDGRAGSPIRMNFESFKNQIQVILSSRP